MVYGEAASLGVPVLSTETCSAIELVQEREIGRDGQSVQGKTRGDGKGSSSFTYCHVQGAQQKETEGNAEGIHDTGEHVLSQT